jgi:hypothetical protein
MIIFAEKILKKKDLQNGKHNKKFNEDYQPYFSSPARHTSESVVIKPENPVKYRIVLSHSF